MPHKGNYWLRTSSKCLLWFCTMRKDWGCALLWGGGADEETYPSYSLYSVDSMMVACRLFLLFYFGLIFFQHPVPLPFYLIIFLGGGEGEKGLLYVRFTRSLLADKASNWPGLTKFLEYWNYEKYIFAWPWMGYCYIHSYNCIIYNNSIIYLPRPWVSYR